MIQSLSNATNTGAFAAGGPFSMTLQSEYDLKPFGQLVNRGIDLASGPVGNHRPGMTALGFTALGYEAFRRNAKARRGAMAI
jgi:hypothetical protein